MSDLSILSFFTDPILRAPTIATMLMCLTSSLIGVILFIRKRMLLGEALSHAAYPGVVLSCVAAAALFSFPGEDHGVLILLGAALFSFLGLLGVDLVERKLSVHSDAALCLILSTFFGLGVLVASRLQVTNALWYKQIEIFLYGQAATLLDSHVIIYLLFAAVAIAFVFFLYRPIELINFDRDFAKSMGVKTVWIEMTTFFLLILSIVVGMRCVGVVLMSGMLIAPAVAARGWTSRLSSFFVVSALFGMVSAFLGNYLSVILPLWIKAEGLALPTGPMILLVAASFAIFSLLLAPRTGLVSRMVRILSFRRQCQLENLLKALWKRGEKTLFTYWQIAAFAQGSWLFRSLLVFRLYRQGWLEKSGGLWRLSLDGWNRASHIVRLHRLWEVYLVDYLGQNVSKVHQNAEEMEHIITPELEQELTELLQNPTVDPHQQPIPEAIFRSKNLR